jgi:general secretion pathway protein G
VSAPQPRSAKARAALTIVELLIAIAVVAALAAIAIPQFHGYSERARVKQAVADIQVLEGTIGAYSREYGRPPKQLTFAVDPVPLDPWGNAYQYLDIAGASKKGKGKVRKDKNLVPINSDYDLYSMGADGKSQTPLTAKASRDDVVRANNGKYVGLAEDY